MSMRRKAFGRWVVGSIMVSVSLVLLSTAGSALAELNLDQTRTSEGCTVTGKVSWNGRHASGSVSTTDRGCWGVRVRLGYRTNAGANYRTPWYSDTERSGGQLWAGTTRANSYPRYIEYCGRASSVHSWRCGRLSTAV